MIKTKRIIPIFFFLVILSLLISPASAVSSLATNPIKNDLTNWNFETGTVGQTPTGWTGYGTAVISTSVYAAGARSLKPTAAAGHYSDASQSITAEVTGNFKGGAWVYFPSTSTGSYYVYVYIQDLTKGTGKNIDAYPASYPLDTWVFIETDSLAVTSGDTLRMNYGVMSTSGTNSAYIDGTVMGQEMTTVSPTEYYLNNHALHNFYWVSTGNYNNNPACYVWEFSTIDITDPNHSNLGLHTGQIDGGAMSTTRINSMIYNDGLSKAFTAGTSYDFYEQIKLNEALNYISPADSATTTLIYPPLFQPQIFSWQATPKSQIEIATKTDYYLENIIARTESTTGTATIQLKAGSYYWRIRNYDTIQGTWGDWAASRTFTMATPAYPPAGAGVHGVVYDPDDPLNPVMIPGAMVTIYNASWSNTYYTTADGYFQVPLTAGSYYITVTKNLYDSYTNYPFTIGAGAYTALNIALKKSQTYYAPHDVVFTVKQNWYNETGLPGVSYTVYDGSPGNLISSGVTDSNGQFTVKDMNKETKYIITLTYGGSTYTENIMPGLTEYTFVLNKEGIHTYMNSWLSLTYSQNTTNALVTYSSNKTISQASLIATASNGTIAYNQSLATTTGTFNFPFSPGDYSLQFNITALDGSNASQVWTISNPPTVNLFPSSYPTWLKNVLFTAIILIFLLAFGKSKNDVACGSVAVLTSLGYIFHWLTCSFNFVVLVWIIAIAAILLHYKRTGALG